MRVPKQISDAIRMLAWCYHSEELVKVAVVAEDIGITKQMALKLSNILRQQGLLHTIRGPTGGIRLTPLAREASVGGIVRTLLARPELRREAASDAEFSGLYHEAFDAFLAVLDKEQLSELAERSKPKQKKSKPKKQGASPITKSAAATAPKVIRSETARQRSRTR